MIARDTLSAGGSAMDAAVAAGFALSVTLPSRAGLGGGGACLVFEQSRGETQAILFEAGARRSMASGADRPAAVPMLARGLFALHTRGGRLRFEELIRPAEDLAREGNPVSRAFAADLAAVAAPLFADPQARAIFAGANGEPVGEGAQLIQRDLALSLSAIRTTGPGDIHQGTLARRLAEASLSAGGGLTVDDMRAGIARLVPPVTARQGNDTISFLPTGSDAYTARSFEALAAGGANADGGPPGGGASTGLVTFDRDGNAVACAFSMNNLFGTGRVAPGTGIILAAAPNVGAILPAPLAVTLSHNQPLRAFRLAVAASGQEAAPYAAALATSRLLRGAAAQDAIPGGVPAYARAVVASCPRYLPGRPDECVIAADPRGSGLAAGAAPR
nr:gamma-glutamyltransferase [Plastoroseomonas arctica]